MSTAAHIHLTSCSISAKDKLVLFLGTLLVLINPMAAAIAWFGLGLSADLQIFSMAAIAIVNIIVGGFVYGFLDIKDHWTPLILLGSIFACLLAVGLVLHGLGLSGEGRQNGLTICFGIATLIYAFGYFKEL